MHRWCCSTTSLKVGAVAARYYTRSHLPLHGLRPLLAMVGEKGGSLRTARRSVMNPPQTGTTTQNGSKIPMEKNLEGEFASKHFDFQDVDADRLTHFYWDRSEDGNPYQSAPDFQWMGEDEFEQDNLAHISLEDRKYLTSEYL
ncbi:unnamed protein product [Phytomonas sp. Hart1]|nr:unnamed protein product [Phytomonas sp. Hart1]|eukprot:CCW67942.1 unnamed protein product [Phytomonas sp. isolate Hart1]